MSSPEDGQRVLLVEDDRPLRETLEQVLCSHDYAVVTASDGIQAAQLLRTREFDVVLLDIGLPFVNGWEILAQLEGTRQPSVIVISASGDEDGKVRALDLGADDYLTKPFGAGELLARLRAVRRRSSMTSDGDVVSVGDVTVDLASRSARRGGIEVRLSPTEWALLALLASHPGVVTDHRTLLASVWGPSYIGDRNYLRTFIGRLRTKLEALPSQPEVIVTVGYQGYRFGPAPGQTE